MTGRARRQPNDSWRVRRGAPFAIELRRVVLGQSEIVSRLASASASDAPVHERVHRVRQAVRRVRAIRALLRGAATDAELRAVDQALRGAARRLARVRDADVEVLTFDRVVGEREAAVRARLAQRARRLDEQALDLLERVAEQVAGACRDLAAAIPDGLTLEDVEPSVRWAYRRARRQLDVARQAKDIAEMHELRKRIKVTRAEVSLLARPGDERHKKTAASLDRLNDLLGDLHDLDVLAHDIDVDVDGDSDGNGNGDGDGDGEKERRDAKRARRRIERRMTKLRAVSLAEAEAALRRKPRRFAQQLVSH